MSTPPPPSTPGFVLQRRLVEAALLAVPIGLLVHRTWAALARARVLDALVLVALWAAAAAVLARVRRWPMAITIAAVGVMLLVVMAGPLPVLATLLLVAAAIALGSLVVDGAGVAFVVGAALIAGIAGWSLGWPVHTRIAWTLVLGAIVLARWATMHRLVRTAAIELREATAAAPRATAWSMLALGLASTGTWLPTLQYDDLAYHLGMPWQLMTQARYVPDVTQQVWAYAPWAGDVLQGIAQVMAHAEARGPVDAAWLVACAALSGRLVTRLGATPAVRACVVALVATLPPIAALAAGMQTELPAATVLLALAVLAVETPTARTSIAVGALVGLLAGLKLLHPAAGIGVVAWAAVRALRAAGLRGALAIVGAAFVVGGSSYVQAAHACGNPVLPLFNAIFRSPCFPPVDFVDLRWQTVPGLPLPWSMTFLTHRHLEAFDGGLGFLLVGLAGAAIVALLQPRTRIAAACALVAITVPMAVMPYARYVVPGLVLLVPPAAVAIARCMPERRAIALLVALCVLDAAFQANAHWMLRTGAVKRALLAGGRDAPLVARYAPERRLVERLRAQAPEAVVLDLGGASHAELGPFGRTTAWYAPPFSAAARVADTDASGAAWARLLRENRIDRVLLRDADATPARRAGLARAGAHRVLTEGPVECWALPAPRPE